MLLVHVRANLLQLAMRRSRGRKAPARRIVEFSLGAVPMERGASTASLSHEEAGPGSPPPFAEAALQRSAETAQRIRRASAPSSVGLSSPEFWCAHLQTYSALLLRKQETL